MNYEQWYSFKLGAYTREIDVRDFIQRNYTPYAGGPEFLAPATGRTKALWAEVLSLYGKEPSFALSIMRGVTVFCMSLYVSMFVYTFAGLAKFIVTGKQALSNAVI